VGSSLWWLLQPPQSMTWGGYWAAERWRKPAASAAGTVHL
jgi:hypothetical protein